MNKIMIVIAIFLIHSISRAAFMEEDWNSLSVELQQQADAKQIELLLAERVPALLQELQKDANNELYKNLWGQCINFDELAKGIVVEPAILDVLLQDFGMAPRNGLYLSAGLQHTYGYLFSTLKTAFGFKRDRWIQPEIALGFALPEDILGPFPRSGTLFSNISYLMAHIAFAKDSERLLHLEQHSENVAAEIKSLPFSALKVRHLVERFENFPIEIHTDIVRFPAANSTGNTNLLVYSVGDRLITAFPVSDSFVDAQFDPKRMGDRLEIRTQFNAYQPGITDSAELLRGSRHEE